MTLVAWFFRTGSSIEYAHNYVKELLSSVVSVDLDEKLAYLVPTINIYFTYIEPKSLWYHIASPTYAQLIPYAGLGDVQLNQRSDPNAVYWHVASLSVTRGWSWLSLIDLLSNNSMLVTNLEIASRDRNLHIKEEVLQGHIALPRLLPQLLL